MEERRNLLSNRLVSENCLYPMPIEESDSGSANHLNGAKRDEGSKEDANRSAYRTELDHNQMISLAHRKIS